MTTVAPRSRVVLDLLAIGRPWFWPVSLVPYYIGIVLATQRLVPAVDQWPRLLAGALVTGPLLWVAVLAVNDAHDLPGDLLNPRKRSTPLTTGRVSPAEALRLAVVAGGLAVLVAVTVGTLFALGAALALALGWAYSAPPLRLKTRAGADVVANAVAVGAFGPLAGWTAVRPLDGFPWVLALLGTLVGIALYLPTMLADHASDRASGYRTTAVRLGPVRTYRLGLAAWVGAAGLAAVLAAADLVIPRRMLLLEVVMAPVLIAAYRRYIGTERSFRGITIVGSLFLLPSVTFVLLYTGVW